MPDMPKLATELNGLMITFKYSAVEEKVGETLI